MAKKLTFWKMNGAGNDFVMLDNRDLSLQLSGETIAQLNLDNPYIITSPRKRATVTAELAVRFRRPTPSAVPVRLVGRVVELGIDRVNVETTVLSGETVTAIGRATFVAVGPGHPAHGRG